AHTRSAEPGARDRPTSASTKHPEEASSASGPPMTTTAAVHGQGRPACPPRRLKARAVSTSQSATPAKAISQATATPTLVHDQRPAIGAPPSQNVKLIRLRPLKHVAVCDRFSGRRPGAAFDSALI